MTPTLSIILIVGVFALALLYVSAYDNKHDDFVHKDMGVATELLYGFIRLVDCGVVLGFALLVFMVIGFSIDAFSFVTK